MIIELTADIDVVCDECGDVLKTSYDRRREKIEVSPCGACLDKERRIAYADGQKDGE